MDLTNSAHTAVEARERAASLTKFVSRLIDFGLYNGNCHVTSLLKIQG